MIHNEGARRPVELFVVGARRAPAFKVGDVVGILTVIDPGNPTMLADKRRVHVQCTACRYKSTVYESWLRALRKRSIATCSMCKDVRRKAAR